jgi:hypothetical protein
MVAMHQRTPPVTLDSLVDSALAEDTDHVRRHALQSLLPHFGPAQIDRVWAYFGTLTRYGHRTELLHHLAPHLDGARLGEALRLARDMRPGVGRCSALSGLVIRLPIGDRGAILDDVIDGAPPGAEMSSVFGRLAPEFSPEQNIRAALLLLADPDPHAGATSVLSLAAHLPPEGRGPAVAAAARIVDEHSRAALLTRWAPHLSAAEARDLLPDVRAMIEADARALTLAAIAAALPPTEQQGVAAEALAALRTCATSAPFVAAAVAPLGAVLVADRRGELLDLLAARDAMERMSTISSLVPYLDDEQLDRALRAVGLPDPVWMWLPGAPLFLPYLPAELRREMQDFCVRLVADTGSTEYLEDLLDHLRDDQVADLLRTALDGSNPDLRSFAALAPRMNADQVGAALTAVTTAPDPDSRAYGLVALAPHLDPDSVSRVCTAALSEAAPDCRAEAFTALAARMTGTPRRALTAEAAQSAAAVRDPYHRGIGLVAVAAVAADADQRQDVLRIVVATMPTLDVTSRMVIRTRIAEVLSNRAGGSF